MTLALDTTLVAYLIVLSWAINGVAGIAMGAAGVEKKNTYGAFDIAWGLLTLIFVLAVLLF